MSFCYFNTWEIISLAITFENTLTTFSILYPLLPCLLALKDKVTGQHDFFLRIFPDFTTWILPIKVPRYIKVIFFFNSVDLGISLVQKKFSSIISLNIFASHCSVLFFRNAQYAYPLYFMSTAFYLSSLSLLFPLLFHFF